MGDEAIDTWASPYPLPARGVLCSHSTCRLRRSAMDETTIDHDAMGKLAQALAFICGAEHRPQSPSRLPPKAA